MLYIFKNVPNSAFIHLYAQQDKTIGKLVRARGPGVGFEILKDPKNKDLKIVGLGNVLNHLTQNSETGNLKGYDFYLWLTSQCDVSL